MNKIINADCISGLKTLPDGCVNTCVTSPPYFGLRDYGVDGQIGLEETPQAYVEKMVAVFQEVKRVLRDDGTLWLNLGDSYAGSWGNAGGQNHGKGTQRTIAGNSITKDSDTDRHGDFVPPGARGFKDYGIKPKDLIGIPWRVAFALQADGWYLRQDIIWAKPNPMPESVTDRCTKSHEYIFLLSKGPKYYFDHKAICEDCVDNGHESRKKQARFGGANKHAGYGTRIHSGREYVGTADNKRNKRDVWTVATKPYKEAHFATFPPEMIRPCVLAGCPSGGLVLDPFMGAGTTALVAVQERRQYVGFELSPEYIKIAEKRIAEAEPTPIPEPTLFTELIETPI